jgi:hypothetical protein
MRISNSYGLGCNIMQAGYIFQDSWGRDLTPAQILETLKKKIRNSYARVLMLNIHPKDLERKELQMVLNEFPLVSSIQVDSSMGNYSTTLFILDVSKVKKTPQFEAYRDD